MEILALTRRCRRLLLAGAVALALVSLAAPSRAQVYEVGAGGTLQNDTASGGGPSSFSKGGYFGFGEIHLDMDTRLQLRVASFRLPGKLSDSPGLSVTELSLTGMYLFRENWFSAGFYGGIGVFRIAPDSPTADQTAYDPRESVWGLKGGVLTLIRLEKRIDLRLEGGVTYLASTYGHSPITLGAAISYRF